MIEEMSGGGIWSRPMFELKVYGTRLTLYV
jgi:hypothetical protein